MKSSGENSKPLIHDAEAALRRWRHDPNIETPVKRVGDKLAATVRRLRNNPWHEAPVSQDDAEGKLSGLEAERESGERVLVRCNLPADMSDCKLRNSKVGPLYDLEVALCALAGGFTVWEGRGGWVDSARNMLFEPVRIYECSVPPGRQDSIIGAFEACGVALGEQWTHITTSIETAHHVKTGGTKCRYPLLRF